MRPHTAPPDGQWFNGAAESLVKSIKKAITASVGEAVMTFSELQTVVFEAAGLVNERPIGNHPSSPDESTYLTPNDLLLGRATRQAPQGPFEENSKVSYIDLLGFLGRHLARELLRHCHDS